MGTVALAVFCWHLGSSSLFGDEATSWDVARGSTIIEVLNRVRANEIAPPPYYVLLHIWIYGVGDDDWLMRLPSVIAAAASVGLVSFAVGRQAGRNAAVVVGVIGVLSPLMLGYAQQVRAYAFAMLALALALVALEYAIARGGRLPWVTLYVATVGAVWTHYTVMPAVLALWFVVWRHRHGGVGHWRAYGLVIVAATLVITPLALDQLSKGHTEHGDLGALNVENLAHTVGLVFDGRHTQPLVVALLGGAILLVALVLSRKGSPAVTAARVGTVLTVVLVAIAAALGADALGSRYAAVAAPLALVVIGVAIARAPRALGVGLAATCILLALWGTFASQRQSGYYPDARGAIATIAPRAQPGDAVVSIGGETFDQSLRYYLNQRGSKVPVLAVADPAGVERALDAHGRVWIVTGPDNESFDRGLARVGVQRLDRRRLATAYRLTVTLGRKG